ncbi:MAG: hypothetical protein R2911_45070 [Caldilineaceae bacterium]
MPADPIVPKCVFEPPTESIPNEPIISLDSYIFTEPQVILTDTEPIGIGQWLLDNESLLIVQQNSAKLLNPQIQEQVTIIESRQQFRTPIWLSENNTLVFAELYDAMTQSSTAGLWLQSMNPPLLKQLSNSVASSSFAPSPNGTELVFVALPGGTRPYIWNQRTKVLSALPIDLANWRYQKRPLRLLRSFRPLWSPSGNNILFHDGAWLFLYDRSQQVGCEIDIQQSSLNQFSNFVIQATWSPNGRYIAMKVSEEMPSNGPFDQLIVLDTYTGEISGHILPQNYLTFSISSDNQTLAMLADSPKENNTYGIYLYNMRSHEFQHILPDVETRGSIAQAIVWSPQGNKIAFQCTGLVSSNSDNLLDALCLSQVSTAQ